jgi:alginate O-acetyltransferase complex protein AlgI
VRFNSFQFAFFFIVVWILFLCLRGTPRKVLLLAASYYFYMCWSAKYIVVIWGITIIDYIAGLAIEQATTLGRKRLCLGVSLACNLGLLAVFKYLDFLGSSITPLMRFAGLQQDIPLMHIILPIGLSFHTFQAMSYTIDVYRGNAPAERKLLNYALYVAFFPQLVAGPVERPNELLPQFHSDPKLRLEQMRSGFAQALWGFFKKMVIADSVAEFVNVVYQNPHGFSGASLLLATILFALQIYCDFSGYSDIALGIARVMGYDLRVNFRQPFFSRTISEFWSRWHISLTTWFRDYVYLPLVGKRVTIPSHYFSVLVTFALVGLWHGASWMFVLTGVMHGVYITVGDATRTLRYRVRAALGLHRVPRLLALWQTLFTVSLVMAAWIFFRAGTLSAGWYILTHLFPLQHFNTLVLPMASLDRINAVFVALLTVAMFIVEWFMAHPERIPRVWSVNVFRYCCYYACVYAVIFFGVFGRTDFIYFQF